MSSELTGQPVLPPGSGFVTPLQPIPPIGGPVEAPVLPDLTGLPVQAPPLAPVPPISGPVGPPVLDAITQAVAAPSNAVDRFVMNTIQLGFPTLRAHLINKFARDTSNMQSIGIVNGMSQAVIEANISKRLGLP